MSDLEGIRPYLELTRPYLEFTAVTTGAISGALHAQRRAFDFVGVVIIGLVSGLGGGMIRDVLLGQGPALALQSPSLLIAAIFASLLGVLLFSQLINHLGPFMWVVDSLALGLFAVAGLKRAEAASLSVVPSVFLGVVTCVGGGLMRDVLCRETPRILLPGQPYSVIALFAGGTYMLILRVFKLSPLTAELLAVSGSFALRLFVTWRGWIVPTPPNLTLRKRRFKPPHEANPRKE